MFIFIILYLCINLFYELIKSKCCCILPKLHRPPRWGLLRAMPVLPPDRAIGPSGCPFRLSGQHAERKIVGREAAERRFPVAVEAAVRKNRRVFQRTDVVFGHRNRQQTGKYQHVRSRRDHPQTVIQSVRIGIQGGHYLAARADEHAG